MPWAWTPPKGKLEKRLYFPPHYGDETTTSYKRAFGKGGVRFPFWERFCYGIVIIFRFWVCGCFVSTVQWIYSFFSIFPLAESMAKAFGWLFLWALRERFCQSIWLFYFILYWKYSLFLQFSRWWAPWLGHFIGYSFGISRNKASTVSYGTAREKASTMFYGTGFFIIYWNDIFMCFLLADGMAEQLVGHPFGMALS